MRSNDCSWTIQPESGLKRGQTISSGACAGMVRAGDSLSFGRQVAVRLLRVLVLAARGLQPISYRVLSVPGVAGARPPSWW